MQRRIARVDGRLKAARRVRELAASFVARNNAADPAAVLRAAELTALAEEARAAALRNGGCADPLGLVRLENAARRAVGDLDLKPEPKRKPLPSVQEMLARMETR
jgi:hypothetical protein